MKTATPREVARMNAAQCLEYTRQTAPALYAALVAFRRAIDARGTPPAPRRGSLL